MKARERIAAIRLIEKLEHNTEYAAQIGVSFSTKKQSQGVRLGKEEKDGSKKNSQRLYGRLF